MLKFRHRWIKAKLATTLRRFVFMLKDDPNQKRFIVLRLSKSRIALTKSGKALGLICALYCGPVAAGNLDGAISPYLKMHADDEIEWHPWSDGALQRAAKEQKLIFLSIGYATCHWCHVQSRTTYSDAAVISLLNRHFISILVDREERPDLDHHFLPIMAAMTGQSGWPANFILTPDLTPLFASGYIAPEPEYGAPGLLQVAQMLSSKWDRNREALHSEAEEIKKELSALFAAPSKDAAQPRADPRAAARRAWEASLDPDFGGFGRGQKFLLSNVLSFLLREAVRKNDSDLMSRVMLTLDHMAAGGVRDQLGGAFHRYTVDRYWQLPHFEIMLDENALMAMLYLDAFKATGQARYAAVARDVLEDLLARFRLPEGGFATALDAESGGVEGGYYTWTVEEVHAVLGPEAAALFMDAYLDSDFGLLKGRSVLRLRKEPSTLLDSQTRLAASIARLREARAKRSAPLRDEKVLTSWNALTVSAFAKAAQVLEEPRFYKVAQEEMARLLSQTGTKDHLVHSRLGKVHGNKVFLDDYAFLVQALLDLYETDYRVGHLDEAHELMETLFSLFQIEPGTPFHFAPADQETDIPTRAVLDEFGAPSGNAAALTALNRLLLYGGEASFEARRNSLMETVGRYVSASGSSAPGLLGALDYQPAEAREIVIVGDINSAATRSLVREVYRRLLLGTVVAVLPPDAPEENLRWPLLNRRPLLADKPTAYLCRNRLCNLPVDTPQELASQLDAIGTGAEQ